MGMIKSEREYQQSKKKVQEMDLMLQNKDSGHLKTNLGIEAFKSQIQDEINEYENIKNGKIPESYFLFENIGLLLISLRIHKGITQAELAKRLDVPASQVSRDENNDYHGVSVVTIKKILKALEFDLTLNIKL